MDGRLTTDRERDPSLGHTVSRMRCRIVAFAMAMAVGPAEAWGQAGARSVASLLPRGSVLDTVVSRTDSSQRYAVYLPSAYTIDRRWPLLFLMDPRGRALLPLQRFRDAAERYGYVLVSSYGTRSDGPREPNDRALDALIPDAQRYLSVDSRRVYLAGFSGTTRFAWSVHPELPGVLAGILGFGAGLPGGDRWLGENVRGAPFALFAAVGSRDPNYEELRALDAQLASTELPHTLEIFEGGHEWPSEPTSWRAVEWLELHAIRRGWRPRDGVWLDSLARNRRAAAARADSAGDAYQAWRLHAALARDFDGLVDVSDARHRADSLARDPRVARTATQLQKLAADDRSFAARLYAMLREVRESTRPPSVADFRRRLGLDAVRKASQAADDSLTADAAHRKLNLVTMHAAFYEPREYVARRQFEHAAAVLQLADWIDPDNGGVCLSLVRALASLGRTADAVEKLQCAIDQRAIGPQALDSLPDLAPLRSLPTWGSLLERARTIARDSTGRR